MSLRIGYLTGEYPRPTDTFIQREVATLRARGHFVQTFSVREPKKGAAVSPAVAESRRTTSYLLPPRGLLKAHLAAVLASPSRYARAAALAWRTRTPGAGAALKQFAYFLEAGLLASRMRELKLQHLHNHFADSSCSVAALAAEIGGFGFSFTVHGPAEFFEMSRWWLGEKVRRAVFVVCISSFCRSQVMLAASPESWGKLKVVHCGVDPALFPPREHSGRGKRLLFVGRLAPEKGCLTLIEALALIPGVALDIVGDGPSMPDLRRRAEELGLADRVVFHGFQGEAEVRSRLSQTDVFVMASFAEGVPIVLMEALAAGVPAVATRIAGIPELIEDGVSGYLVPPAEPERTAEAVRRLIDDPDLRNRMATAGRVKVEAEFNLVNQCNSLSDLFSSALLGDFVSKA